VLDALGVGDKCVLHLNSLGDTESRTAYRGALVAFLQKHEADLSEDSKARLVTNPLRILDSKDKTDRDIIADAPRLQDHLNDLSKAHFETVTKALDAARIAWDFDPLLVRGLDYYCHSAFEFITDSLGAQGTVLGGGRYDGLSEMLGGPPIAGVGWAAGVERLAMLVGAGELRPADIAVIAAEPAADAMVFQLAEMLRDAGLGVDIPLGGNMGKRMKKIDRAGIRLAAIIGGAEIEAGTVQLRDLADGNQTELELSNLAAAVLARLANQ